MMSKDSHWSVEGGPTAGEGHFAMDELFFSTTNKKGILASANEVFARVSGYPLDQMLGKPHNIIRHEDMPRIAFKMLWDEVAAGRPFAAYVKNRTSGGQFYWVMAMVLPMPDGYLSIRLKPSTEHFQVAQDLYRQLRAIEREVEGPRSIHVKPAMEASGEALEAALARTPYGTYDSFMRTALLAEVRSREEALRTSGARGLAVPGGPLKPAIEAIAEVNAFLRQLVLNLDDYPQLKSQLTTRSALVRDLADDVRLFALNAIISSSHVSRGDSAVSAVAELLSSRSEVTGPLFVNLADAVGEASTLLSEMLFPVAAASLQAETLEVFLREIAAREAAANDQRDLQVVHGSFAAGLEELVAIITNLWERLSGLQPRVENLRRGMDTMRALSLNGRIESARMDDGQAFADLFLTVAQQVETSRLELDALGKLGRGLFAENVRRLARVHAAAREVQAVIAA